MIILVGPSASGKTEVCKLLCKKYGYEKFVTTTTREKRVGEIDGIDYNFVSIDNFKNLIKNNSLIEYTQYNNNFYGTEKNNIQLNTILIVDPNGLKSFQKLNDSSIVSFLLTCDENSRINRMKERKDSIEKINERIKIDKVNFSEEKTNSVNFIIPTSNKTIEEIADKVNNLYKDKINHQN